MGLSRSAGHLVGARMPLVGYTLRSASAADEDLARRAHHLGYREVVERQFGSWDEAAQDRFFAGDWSRGGFQIVECDGEPCGYIAVDVTPDAVSIREIVLLPTHQGRGIGTALLTGAIELATSQSVPVQLGALRENRAAALYRRLGFREVGRDATHVFFRRPPGPGP
jgi:ribosomal protein S18 acetylase RimI-like enzyme